MRATWTAVSIAIISALALAPATAAKITTDPNKPGAPAPAKPVDPLAQKITYTSTDKRLHTVLEEISQMTGVKVHCGKSPDDWKVRDLPVVVCVNGLSLGKTLRSIADATHLALTPVTVKDEKQYRIWRDGKRQRQLDDYFQAVEDARLNRFNGHWDAWLALSKASKADIPALNAEENADAGLTEDEFAMYRSWGKVIAALPAGTREKVFAGESIRISTKNSPPAVASALRAYYKIAWELMAAGRVQPEDYEEEPGEDLGEYEEYEEDYGDYEDYDPYEGITELTDAMMDAAEITISAEGGELLFAPESHYTSRYSLAWSAPDGSIAAELLDKNSEEPREPEPPETKYSPNLRPFDPEMDYDLPGLNRKIKLEKPKDRRLSSFVDIIGDVARASGFTFICEDFTSHREYCSDGQYVAYGEQTLEDALLELLYAAEMRWYVDIESKLVVGSAYSWWNDHTSLAPDKIISALLHKAGSTGIEIEDAASTLVTLSEDQRWEWVFVHKDLGFDFDVAPRWEALWRLYAGLTDDGKALASSEKGLPLSILERSRVEKAFDEAARVADKEGTNDQIYLLDKIMAADPTLYRRTEEWAKVRYPEYFADTPLGAKPDIDEIIDDLKQSFPEIKALLEIPRDSALFSRLKMKLIRKPAGECEPPGAILPVSALPSHHYTMTIEGEGIKMSILGPDNAFPVYSQKRQAELIEEARKKAVSTQPEAKP